MRRRDGFERFPIDPDVDVEEDLRHHPGAEVSAPAERRPRLRGRVLLAIFLGGCAGGTLRYAVTDAWPATGGDFPWATFAVNVAGAVVLAALVVVVTDVARLSPYLRPALGTGFCGALTTFSSIVVAADELVSHGHEAMAAAYVLSSVAAGLAAAALGAAVARAVVARAGVAGTVEAG